MALRLGAMTGGQRESLLGALSGDLERRVELTLRVQAQLPGQSAEEVGRDVEFLLRSHPGDDATGRDLLLGCLSRPQDFANPQELQKLMEQKGVYADYLEESNNPLTPALRAEIAAVEAGMPPRSVLGVLEAGRHLGVAFTPAQADALAPVPFSADTLRACAGTHLLFPGYPLSLLGLREHFPGVFSGYMDWCAEEGQKFSRREVPLGWHLLRAGPLPGSFRKSAADQARGLPEGESIPGVAEAALAAALHKLATGRELFGIDWYRTADQTAGGNWVGVDWDGGRLSVYYWHGRANAYVGSASARTSF